MNVERESGDSWIFKSLLFFTYPFNHIELLTLSINVFAKKNKTEKSNGKFLQWIFYHSSTEYI